jgi:hypothetical protein
MSKIKHSPEILVIAKKVSQIDSYFQNLEDTNKYLSKQAERISSSGYDDEEGYGWETCSEQAIKSTYYKLLALLIDNNITEEEALKF